MFGGLGILAGNPGDWACVPLSIRLHDGLQTTYAWKGAAIHLKELFKSHKERFLETQWNSMETGNHMLLQH